MLGLLSLELLVTILAPMWKESTREWSMEKCRAGKQRCVLMPMFEHSDVAGSGLLSYLSQYILFIAQITLCLGLIERWPNLTDHIIFLKVTFCRRKKQSFYHIKCQRHLCSRIFWKLLGRKSIWLKWCLFDVVIGLRPTLDRFMFHQKPNWNHGYLSNTL